MSHPVEVTAVNDTAAYSCAVAVHVFCCGVCNDVSTPFERSAVDGCCKCVVDDQGNTVCMGCFCESFDIQNCQCRVCDRFAEYCFCVGSECCFQFFIGAVGGYECEFYAHFFHCYGEQVECTAVDCRRSYYMVAAVCDVEHCIEVCSLTGRCQHCCCAAFQFADFCCYIVTCGVLQSGIEVAACFQVKQFAHVFACAVFECCALVNRDLSGFTVAGCIAALYTFCFNTEIAHFMFLLGKSYRKVVMFVGLYVFSREKIKAVSKKTLRRL